MLSARLLGLQLEVGLGVSWALGLSLVLEGLGVDQGVVVEDVVVLEVIPHVGGLDRGVELVTQPFQDPVEGLVFFLHFLVVASTLLCLASADEV